MRKIYEKGHYTLGDGDGTNVEAVSVTAEFVIVQPLHGGNQMVLTRESFEDQAVISNNWHSNSRWAIGRRDPNGARRTTNWASTPHRPPSPARGDWCIDLALVSDDAYVWVIDE